MPEGDKTKRYSGLPVTLGFYLIFWLLTVNIWTDIDFEYWKVADGLTWEAIRLYGVAVFGAFVLFQMYYVFYVMRKLAPHDKVIRGLFLALIVFLCCSVGLHILRVFVLMPAILLFIVDGLVLIFMVPTSIKAGIIDSVTVTRLMNKTRYAIFSEEYSKSVQLAEERARSERLKRDETYVKLREVHEELEKKASALERLNRHLLSKQSDRREKIHEYGKQNERQDIGPE